MSEGFPPGIQQLEQHLVELDRRMQLAKKNGHYDEAEQVRINIEDGEKQLQRRRLQEMDQRHSRQNRELAKAHQQELNQFNQFWDNKRHEFQEQARKVERQMLTRHLQQIATMRQQLEQTIPLKYKESSELLNLKKMEEHMVKQKNFAQAHKVQAKINQLDKQQNGHWLQVRANKIQTAINQLKDKQNMQLSSFKKRISTATDQQNTERKSEQSRLVQKYNNVKTDLTSQHEKQCLFFKGHFRSKVNVSTSLSKSRS